MLTKNQDKETGAPTALDLFCGAGGLTLGLKMAGFRVLAGFELNPVAAETYRLNHPKVKLYEGNIQDVCIDDVVRNLGLNPGQLDLLAGCPPCQGYSSIRTLNGKNSPDDARNGLLDEMLRFARALLPRSIMMENVRGLAKDLRFTEFLEALESLGYHARNSYRIQDAQHYGVPQRRQRLVLLAGRHRTIRFPRPATVPPKTVRAAFTELAKRVSKEDPLRPQEEKRSEKVRAIIASVPKDGGSRADLPSELVLDCHKKCNGFKDIYGRLAWDKPAPTITGGCFNPSKGRFLHPEEDRCISMREASVLQGFPPDYKFSLKSGITGVAQMIGNALPPEFIRRHVEGVLA